MKFNSLPSTQMLSNTIIDPPIVMKSDLTENFYYILSNTVSVVRKRYLSICRTRL